MLPRKLHLEQINRFHDKIETMRKEIDLEEDKDKKTTMIMKYLNLTDKMWSKIDDFIEYDIKNKLDILEGR